LATSPAVSPAAQDDAAARATEVALDKVFEAVNRGNTPGLVVGVALRGQTVYRKGFGLASVEHGVANTPATRMRIGSTTKHMAALAALLLAEDGLLDIEAPVGRYLPELPELQGRPTLRQLMNHTSGLRCVQELAFVAADLTVQPAGKNLAAYLRQTDVNFAPGEGQLYCNGGYHVLSLVIARVSGLSFEQFLRRRLFEPLGMHDTLAVPSDMTIVPRLATLHMPGPTFASDGTWRRGILVNEEVRGEGSVVSTVDDMLRWMAHLRGPRAHGRVGSEASWRQLTAPTELKSGVVSGYGLGLQRDRYRGMEVISHAGGVIGGNSEMITVPAFELDIAIMCNGALVSASMLARQVIDTLLAEHLQGGAPAMAASAPCEHLFGTRYHGADGLVFGFDDVAGMLGISMQLSPHAPVLRDEGDSLRVGFEDIGMGPFEIRTCDLQPGTEGGAPQSLTLYEGGYPRSYRRVPAPAPDLADAGPGFVGRYRSTDLDVDARVGFEAQALVMHWQGGYGSKKLLLDAIAPTLFGANVQNELVPNRYALTLQRSGDRVTGFHISTGRIRHVHFERLPD
jgi:D-aminopeptidase